MKSSVKIYGIAFLIAFLIVTLILSIQWSKINKSMEQQYSSMHERICKNVLEKGYSKYILENDNNDDDKFEQYRCYITNISDGVNNSISDSDNSSREMVTDVFRYYDKDMNSIMKDNTLMLITVESEGDSKTRIYYTYEDDSLKEQMQGIINEYGDRIGTVVFHVTDGYIKNHEFVPAKLTYYSVGQGGSLSNETALFTNVKDKESMENDGYSFYHIDNEFTLGQIGSGNENEEGFVVYCREIDPERMERIDALIKESQNLKRHSNDGRIFIKKKQGIFAKEYFTINEFSPEDGAGPFYSVTYEKKNALFDILSYATMEKYGFVMIFIMILEVIAGIVLAFVGGYLYQKKIKNKALSQDNGGI